MEAGKAALLKRRIEKNEERAVKIAEFYATAQKQYRSMTGFYASKFQSTFGKKDGLYWENGPDGIASPLDQLVVRAQNLGYQKQGKEVPVLTGYNFRVLTEPAFARLWLDYGWQGLLRETRPHNHSNRSFLK